MLERFEKVVKIELEGVSRRFGDIQAVDAVDMIFGDGSYTVLLGPSGCGKSTTLNMVAGLEKVSSGRILFGGTEVQRVPPHRRDVAMMFQSYALYPNRTVHDNIAFPLRMAKLPHAEVTKRVAAAAERLRIQPLLGRRPRALSGGQQQRVGLARALVRRPKAFLLDEPMSNLDAKLRAEMQLELKELQRELDGTFVHVTHDQVEAMSLADTLVVMADGAIQQVGTPMEVHRRPANIFVASFVGVPAMNLVEGEAHRGRFSCRGWTTPVDVGVDGRVILGVRPEDLRIEPVTTGSGARIRLVEHLGSSTLCALDSEAGRLVALVDADAAPPAGASVHVTVRPGRVHLFGLQSGTRLGTTSTVTPPAGH